MFKEALLDSNRIGYQMEKAVDELLSQELATLIPGYSWLAHHQESKNRSHLKQREVDDLNHSTYLSGQIAYLSPEEKAEIAPQFKIDMNMEDRKRLLFAYMAEKHICGKDCQETELLRDVFVEGLIQGLKPDGSLEKYANSQSLPWDITLRIFEDAMNRYYAHSLEQWVNK